MGLFNAILTYDGRLTISATVDPTLMPDPWMYMDCLRAAFDELAAQLKGESRDIDTIEERTIDAAFPAAVLGRHESLPPLA